MQGSVRKDVVFGAARVYTVAVPGPKWKSWLKSPIHVEELVATAESTLFCANHPDQSAVARCDHCDKPFCGDCSVEDVAAEEVFCSQPCREERTKTQWTKAQGIGQSIRTGWRLWRRSSVAVWLYTAPLAIVIVIALRLGFMPGAESGQSTGASVVVSLLALAFGIALTQVVLSRQYSGLVQGNPYVWTLRRFVPWTLTTIIVWAAELGGIYLGLKVFWADELALIRRKGPVQALKESWELTGGHEVSIFLFQFLVGVVGCVVLIVALFLALMVPIILSVWAFNEVLQEGEANVVAAFIALHASLLQLLLQNFFLACVLRRLCRPSRACDGVPLRHAG